MAVDIASLTVGEVLIIAIRLEEDGIEFYRAASQKAHSKHLRDVLNILADQETEHKMTFQAIGENTGLHLTHGHHSTRISRQNIQSLIEAGIFPLPEEREAAMASLHSAAQALRFGVKVEKGSIVFYESAAKSTKWQDVRIALNEIVDQERQHLRLLTAELKALKASSTA